MAASPLNMAASPSHPSCVVASAGVAGIQKLDRKGEFPHQLYLEKSLFFLLVGWLVLDWLLDESPHQLLWLDE